MDIVLVALRENSPFIPLAVTLYIPTIYFLTPQVMTSVPIASLKHGDPVTLFITGTLRVAVV